MITYTENHIRTARVLLEELEVHGVENCKRIVMLRQILDSGNTTEVSQNVKSDRNGNKSGDVQEKERELHEDKPIEPGA